MMGKGSMPGMGGAGGMNPQMMQMMQQKGGMPPQMQGGPRPMGGAPMPQPQAQQPMQPGNQPLNASVLAAAPPAVQKQMIGEKLFPAIAKYQPDLAGKVTGMMLEMDSAELIMLLENEQQLQRKVDEAMQVLA